MFAATLWHLGNTKDTYINAAFQMYRNYDGKGAQMGSTGLHVANPKPADISVYASTDGGKIILVLINKKAQATSVDVSLPETAATSAKVYALTENASSPSFKGTLPISANHLFVLLPAMSVATVEIE